MAGMGGGRVDITSWGWLNEGGTPATGDDPKPPSHRLWRVRIKDQPLLYLGTPAEMSTQEVFILAIRLDNERE